MTTNLSQQKREKLLENIKIMREKLQADPDLVKSLADIESELKRKKYGLVWEEHEERVDEEIKTKIPVFVEEKDLEIKTDGNKPINFLLEGDNLHSLYLLEKTHKEKIDVIYIDPPYNTGNKDFIYDDIIVDKEDGYRHSKWLSFIEKRLKIGRELLKENGIAFISIGEIELANLKLLCDNIFGENNFITIISRLMKSGGNKGRFFSPNIDYILVYTKDILKIKNFKTKLDEKVIKKLYNNIETEGERKGKRYREFGLYQSSLDSRPNQRYYIECPNGDLVIPPGETMPNDMIDGEKILPNKNDGCWRWSVDRYLIEKEKGNIVYKKTNKGVLIDSNGKPAKWNIYTKIWLSDREEEGQTPTNFVSEFENRHSAKELAELKVEFDFAKPVELIKYLLSIIALNKDIICLDFFAGSGTTGQAVLEMNKEDNGDRKFILCTNNENNICREITYKRIKKVIEGYSNKEGIKANLKYYKTEYIDRFNHKDDQYYIINELSRYIKELVQLEKGVDIFDKSVEVLFTDEEVDKFYKDKEAVKSCKTLYVDTNALITDEQMDLFTDNNMEICYIPEYYFEDEILEVEQW